jgi:peptidoglycan hydrolase-like protein with peptidoglycan-binding domain
VLGTRATATAVLADLTWPARTLVPRRPATAAVASLRRFPTLLSEAKRAPATLIKVALASSMTITILGSSAAAAIHANGGAPGITGQLQSAQPWISRASVRGAHPYAAGKGAAGHSALASGALGSGPASGTLPPTTAAAPSGPPVVPTVRSGLPPGKGMWLYEPSKVEGGNVSAIVAKATATGLHYLYVHLGSSTDGFFAQAFLNQLLPAAHAAHIRVYGWDFPFFTPPEADVSRALAEIYYRTPSGDRIDGFAPDIEPEPGVNLSAATASTYSIEVRNAVGARYPLIGVVPRPNGSGYPYSSILSHFDAVAVMDYWLDAEPGADIAKADANLAGQNVAMIPIGQAYNGAENGVPGSPSGAAISRFMQVAEQTGAVGISFWSWQDTTPEEWDAIRNAPQFTLPTFPAPMTAGQIRTWQVLLSSLGFPAWPTGVWDQSSVTAVSNYQRAAHLPITGVVDDATKAIILTPVPPPIQPAQLPAPAPAPTTTAPTTTPANPSVLLPFLSPPHGMGTPTSAPASH